MKVERQAFEAMVREVLDRMPGHYRRDIENVAFLVQDMPDAALMKEQRLKDRNSLLGIYQGVPHAQRLPTAYTASPPDRIILFQSAHETAASSLEELKSLVRDTVLHEVGHYFGLSEKEIRKALGE